MSKEKEIRYFIEHQLVRKWFFEEGKQFTGTLAEHNEIFPRMVRQIFYENGCEYPYTDDQFTVAALHLEGDIYCISIGMPEPEYEGECHQILMIFDIEDRAGQWRYEKLKRLKERLDSQEEQA